MALSSGILLNSKRKNILSNVYVYTVNVFVQLNMIASNTLEHFALSYDLKPHLLYCRDLYPNAVQEATNPPLLHIFHFIDDDKGE